MLKATLFFIFISISVSCFAQLQIDTTALLFSAKFQVISEYGLQKAGDWEKNFDSLHKARFLNSKQFGRLYFILIQKRQARDNSLDTGKIKLMKENSLLSRCDYILAYSPNTNLFYKLKGFITNEIDFLLSHATDYPIMGGNGCFAFLNAKNLKEFSLSMEAFQFHVENLDLNCLFEYYKYKISRKKKRTRARFPCSISCYERDRKYSYVE